MAESQSSTGDYVANVVHELKAPLAVVRAVLETLHDDEDMEPADRRGFHQQLEAQCRRLTELVDRLLLLSSLDSQPVRFEWLDLREPAGAALEALAPLAKARRIGMQVELGSKPLRVQGDREQLRQALGNLIENALKYTPEGGRVWVRAGSDGGQVRVEVGDTGIGIPTDEQQRIFTRFYRVDKAQGRDVSGAGLGLCIVRQVALSHGGDVAVRSTPGEGSVFTLELPVAAQPGSSGTSR